MPLGAGRFGLLGGVADLGKLELIQTQTISSSTANMNFIDIKEDIFEYVEVFPVVLPPAPHPIGRCGLQLCRCSVLPLLVV